MKGKTRIIGRYPILKKLGQGSMGSVYLAHDEMIDRKVAIKAIRIQKSQSVDERQKSRDLFFDEARIVGKLNHPHITAVYDMGLHGYTPYLVMEYISGVTLADLIRSDQKLSLRDMLSLMAMICQAVNYVHKHGILHRDLKPANIMINMEQLTPKIMDFGVAKPAKAQDDDFANWAVENQSLCGTPYYMSPEQILGNDMSPRSDLFSLGVVFYEWLAGVRPFQGGKMLAILRGIVERTPVLLCETSEIEAELSQVIHKALDKDPLKRYATASEFADAIELYREKLEKMDNPEMNESLDVTIGSQQTIGELRKQYHFFFEFSDRELFELFQIATPESYREGDVIIQEGHTGARMYFIVEGQVQVRKKTRDKNAVIKNLSGGDCFGEMAVIDNSPRNASVIALEPVHVIVLNETVLRHANPVLCLKLFRSLAGTICERLRLTDQRYLDLLGGLDKLSRESGFILD